MSRQYTGSKAIPSHEVGMALHKAGLLPNECRRIIIDIKAGSVVKIHYETNADPEVLKVIAGLYGAEIVGVSDPLEEMLDRLGKIKS